MQVFEYVVVEKDPDRDPTDAISGNLVARSERAARDKVNRTLGDAADSDDVEVLVRPFC
jgi:hypothetical protein